MSSEAKLRPHADPPPVRRNRDRLREILREQPALLLTISYLMLTSLGLGYQFAFFLQFRVNILDYAEISDFLLAAIREPAVLVLGLAPLLLLWAVQRFGEWLKTRNTRFAALSGRTDTPLMRAVTYPFFIAIYFFLFALKYGERVATSIKAGQGKQVRVELASSPARDTAAAAEAPEALLLGKTTAFIFLYYPSERRTHIVPIENIARIVVLRPVRIPGTAPKI